MWCDDRTWRKPVLAKTGEKWHFKLWFDWDQKVHTQRIYFWDASGRETGMAEFSGDRVLKVDRLRQIRLKLANDAAYRRKFLRKLDFPLERHY